MSGLRLKLKEQTVPYLDGFAKGFEKGVEIGGGSGGEVVLEELTVTKNGVYEPREEEVKLGETYTFKEDLGDIDFEALFNAGMAFDEDGVVGSLLMQGGEYGIALQNVFGIYIFGASTPDYNVMYITQELMGILLQQGAPVEESLTAPCWIDSKTMSQVPIPTIIIPENEDDVHVPLSLLGQLFETEMASNKGFNRVIVDVAFPEPNITELYIPTHYGEEDIKNMLPVDGTVIKPWVVYTLTSHLTPTTYSAFRDNHSEFQELDFPWLVAEDQGLWCGNGGGSDKYSPSPQFVDNFCVLVPIGSPLASPGWHAYDNQAPNDIGDPIEAPKIMFSDDDIELLSQGGTMELISKILVPPVGINKINIIEKLET